MNRKTHKSSQATEAENTVSKNSKPTDKKPYTASDVLGAMKFSGSLRQKDNSDKPTDDLDRTVFA